MNPGSNFAEYAKVLETPAHLEAEQAFDHRLRALLAGHEIQRAVERNAAGEVVVEVEPGAGQVLAARAGTFAAQHGKAEITVLHADFPAVDRRTKIGSWLLLHPRRRVDDKIVFRSGQFPGKPSRKNRGEAAAGFEGRAQNAAADDAVVDRDRHHNVLVDEVLTHDPCGADDAASQ